jgi:hypothetical protein
MKEFDAYAVGLISASVCTSMSIEEATRQLNIEHPTGINSKWVFSDDPTFATGETNPCPCDHSPTTHQHMLFNC